jgi:uncharacterized protein DUF1573
VISRAAKAIFFASSFLIAFSLIAVSEASEPKAVFTEARFEFGQVMSGAVVERDFVVKNEGSAPLMIQKVAMTAPLLVTRQTQEVAPGAEGTIHFKLDTANLAGKFQGAIVVFLNDPALPQTPLAFEGTIVPAIELSPMPAFYVAGLRGRGGQRAIEILNHESEPLQIEKMDHSTERFTTKLETLQAGQRYRLTLTLNPQGPDGKAVDTILLRTSSKKIPVLKIDANTYLYERVRTFPDMVDLGTWRVDEAARAALTLMIYQEGGSDFQAKLSTDVPALRLKWERGPKGDRYQATITFVPDKIRVGSLNGSIFVDSNDSESPRVIVPVYGDIVAR